MNWATLHTIMRGLQGKGAATRVETDLHTQTRTTRVLVVLASLAAYVLAFFLSQYFMGRGLGGLAILPVVAVGWQLGFRFGLFAGFLVIPLNTILYNLSGVAGWDALVRMGGLPESVIAVVIGAAVGRLRDVGDQLSRQVAERKRVEQRLQQVNGDLERRIEQQSRAEAELQRLNELLEKRVEERTRALSAANQELTREIAERERIDAALRESELRYRELFENANDIVYTHDLSGKLLAFNKAAIRVTGYVPEEVPELNIARLIAPEQLAHARDMIQKKVDGDAQTRYELDIVTRDRRRIPVEVSTRLIYDGNRPIAVQGIARDISERREAERVQQSNLHYLESMNRIAMAIEHTADVDLMIHEALDQVFSIFDADRVWLLSPCDPTAETVEVPYERTRPEYPGAHVARVSLRVSPECSSAMAESLASDWPIARTGYHELAAAGDEEFTFSFQSLLAAVIRPRLGKPWWLGMHQCSRPRVWSSEEQRLFRDVASRISDAITHMLLQRDLRESEMKYRSLFENSRDGIYRSTRDGRFIDVNPALVGMLGFSSKEELLTLDAASGLCANADDWKEAVEGKDVRSLRLCKKDGSEVWVESNSRAILDGQGKIVCYEGILRDITERRQLEAQVQHTQKLESLGVLAGGIAHDFNNLLMGMLGNAGLALMELPADTPARESVERIETAALRAADLTNQLLAYSGKGKFLVQPVSLSKLVEEMAHLLDTVISKKTVLRYDFAPDLPLVEADATQIRQVIMNLITNASDAIGESGGTITVRTGVMHMDRDYLTETYLDDDLPEGSYVFVEVTDSGMGMAKETVSKIFDPFFTTKFTGRGLGLAAVLGIVRGHQGAIKVYSEPGRGSTFKVLLPSTEKLDPVALASRRNVAAFHGTGTVLVVDDEETIRMVTTKTLERFGFRVLVAPDGQAGVDVYREHADEITLVILDMTMPNMSGDEAFHVIRGIRPDARVILSSGFTEQEATDRFRGEGLAGFIQKPYRPTDLLDKVREVLEVVE